MVGLVLHSLMYAPQAALFSELFATSVRLHGGLGGLPAGLELRGALAPIIALQLLGDAHSGDAKTVPVAIYVAISAVITIAAVLATKETTGSSLRHERVVPLGPRPSPAGHRPAGPLSRPSSRRTASRSS